MLPEVGGGPTQRPSMAAPSWQAPREEPLMVWFEERRMRLKGEDWFVYWAVAVEAAKAMRLARIEGFMFDDEGDWSGLRKWTDSLGQDEEIL